MKIYDISQEIFGCAVFPGDPAPRREEISSIKDGDICNLTAFYMCAHNGTHVDAPLHFIDGGDGVDMIPLEKTVGLAYVAECCGEIDGETAGMLVKQAGLINSEAAKRILIKGRAVVTLEAAERFAAEGVVLVGNESQTVGPETSPVAVHKLLLGANTVLLEGIRLSQVPCGVYLLNAAPISLASADGAPCRAILIEM